MRVLFAAIALVLSSCAPAAQNVVAADDSNTITPGNMAAPAAPSGNVVGGTVFIDNNPDTRLPAPQPTDPR